MAHILFKPHVIGPQNDITTPDILIERVCVRDTSSSFFVPVQRLQTSFKLQSVRSHLSITPAYTLIAAGGGVLIGIAALVNEPEDSPTKADILVARSTWRLRNLETHINTLDLCISDSTRNKKVSLGDCIHPSKLLEKPDNTKPTLPRATMVVCPARNTTLTAIAPCYFGIELSDPTLKRTLAFHSELVCVDDDQWDERPWPRYTVGPVGDVKHYI